MPEQTRSEKLAEIQDLRLRIDGLKSQSPAQDSIIEEMQAQVTSLQQRLEALRDLDARLDELRSELTEVELASSLRDSTIAQLANQIGELEDAIAHAENFGE